jgi:hypothetical protein
MSPSNNYNALITRGRKAGLRTSELYSALANRPVEGGEQPLGQADGNGFVVSITQQGQRIYRPLSSTPRG